jgi:hypothetical protein
MLDMRKTINIKEAAFVLGLSATFFVIALLAFSFLMITLILVVGLHGNWRYWYVIVKIYCWFSSAFVISLILDDKESNR